MTTDYDYKSDGKKLGCSYKALPTSVTVGQQILVAEGHGVVVVLSTGVDLSQPGSMLATTSCGGDKPFGLLRSSLAGIDQLKVLLVSRIIVIVTIIIIVSVIVLRWYYKTPAGRLQFDALFLKIPLFGDLNEKTAVARFCRIFGTLTRSGVPILTSMDIVRDTAGNQVIANAIESAKQEIQQGGMMSVALDKEKVFPVLAIQMISIGEETGELDAMMMKVADFYEDEVEQTVKALTSLLEPMMMVVIAGMVGVILLSMYLPMFKVFNEIG